MAGGDVPKKWRFTYAGEVYDERALTMGQAEEIEAFLGLSWLQINPLASAKQCRGILTVLHAERTGRPRDEVYGELGQLTTEQFIVDCFDYVDIDLPGTYKDGFPTEAAAERSTSTSSSSTGRRGTGSRPKSVANASETSS